MKEGTSNLQLTKLDVTAIELKAAGAKNSEIAKQVGRSVSTVDHWFTVGGRLEQELDNRKKALATAALAEARTEIRRQTREATQELGRLLEHKNPSIRLAAAKTILSKCLPDVSATAIQDFGDDLPDAARQTLHEQAQLLEAGRRALQTA